MLCDEKRAKQLVLWFRENRREFAFRINPTPYTTWISEIMLQQTRIAAVLPYYERFREAFPDMETLAKASEDRLLKYWEGLGYYARVRNLQKTAKICMERYGGTLPADYDTLRSLPGIGDYTAAAILSISYDEPYSVVDGNVLRVLLRYTGDSSSVRDPKTKTRCREELNHLLRTSRISPRDFNEGLMELGETVCTPDKNPDCGQCVWKKTCVAYQKGLQASLPVVPEKKKRHLEKKKFLLFVTDRKIALLKRDDASVLKSLYGFPESKKSDRILSDLFGNFTKLPDAKHIFSHVEWQMKGYLFRDVPRETVETMYPSVQWVSSRRLKTSFALPSAFRKWDILDKKDFQ